MKETNLKNWKQFADIADLLDVGDAFSISYSFRGQSDSKWGLSPSLLRLFAEKKISEVDALKLERKAVTEFQSQAHLHISPNELPAQKDVLSWWTIMQHHGAPTRLLDWTKSIFVAAYFAVSENLDRDGVIWLVHVSSLRQKMIELYKAEDLSSSATEQENQLTKEGTQPVIAFVERYAKSQRMIAQQGHFSLCHNILGDHDEIISKSMEEDSKIEVFRKLIIPANQKIIFLSKLRRLNVTAGSLFPGLDGIGKLVQESIRVSVG